MYSFYLLLCLSNLTSIACSAEQSDCCYLDNPDYIAYSKSLAVVSTKEGQEMLEVTHFERESFPQRVVPSKTNYWSDAICLDGVVLK